MSQTIWKTKTLQPFFRRSGESEQRNPSHNPNSASTTTCLLCTNLDTTQTPQWKLMQPEVGHQLTIKYADLLKSTSGCQVCSIIHEGIKSFPDVIGRIRAESDVILRCNPLLHPLEVGVMEHGNAAARWLEFFTLAGQPSPWPGLGPANLVPEKLDVDTAVSRTQRWRDECENHGGCTEFRKTETTLPTRVLDLGLNSSPEDPIKLFETERRDGRYMTLSHCWGPSQLITTTRKTFAERTSSIPLGDLTQTFRDAVALTRSLGVQYLWIDSLCIIQQDTEDWEIEARRMGSVYSQSYLNIAATSSAEGSGGLLKRRYAVIPGVQGSFRLRYNFIRREYLGDCVIHVRPLLKTSHSALNRIGSVHFTQISPLLSRAWVYQERVLAPRTVHFHGTEMLWECKSSSRCECGGLERQKLETFRPKIFDETVDGDMEEKWFLVVQQYSGLDASYPSDKLPALSGIAEQFQLKLGAKYLAGIWNIHLKGLAWAVTDGNKVCRGDPYRAPTWSWASLDKLPVSSKGHQGARVSYTLTKAMKLDSRLSLIRASVQTAGENPFGAVKEGAFIILKAAYLVPKTAEVETEWSTIQIESEILLHFDGYDKPVRLQPDITITSRPLGVVKVPVPQAPFLPNEIRLLLFGQDGTKYHGLVLKSLKGETGTYERLGMVKMFSASSDLIGNAEVGEFKIL